MDNHERYKASKLPKAAGQVPLTDVEAGKQAELTRPPSDDAVAIESPEDQRLRALLERAAATMPMDSAEDDLPAPVPDEEDPD